MKLNEFKTKFSTIKKGQFVKAKWQSIKEVKGVEYKKVSQGVVRFVEYGHIKGVVVVGKVNTNEDCIISNTLFENTKTNNYLVQMATTKVKSHCKYYINGNEVDKATYELGNPPRQSGQDRVVFRVKLENLLELGN